MNHRLPVQFHTNGLKEYFLNCNSCFTIYFLFELEGQVIYGLKFLANPVWLSKTFGTTHNYWTISMYLYIINARKGLINYYLRVN